MKKKPKFKIGQKIVHKETNEYMEVYSVELCEGEYLYNGFYDQVLREPTEGEILDFYS